MFAEKINKLNCFIKINLKISSSVLNRTACECITMYYNKQMKYNIIALLIFFVVADVTTKARQSG